MRPVPSALCPCTRCSAMPALGLRLFVVVLSSSPRRCRRLASCGRVTVDDLMRLRSVFDVRVSPDGAHVAYVVSTPSLATNAQDAQVLLVSTKGDASRRLGSDVRVFAPALPAARLRWLPDGTPGFISRSGRRSTAGVRRAARRRTIASGDRGTARGRDLRMGARWQAPRVSLS